MLKDFVPIDCLDRPRRLRFDVAACRALYMESGKELWDLFPPRWGPGSAALFLWAGLRWEDQKLTLASVEQLVEKHLLGGGAVADLAGPLNRALDESGLLQALSPKPNGQDPDPPSGGGSAPGSPSSGGPTDSGTSESKG